MDGIKSTPKFNYRLPIAAIVAVTLNCNSKCIMCDIWKNHINNELKPEEYLKLPSSLVDINLAGGEPFLRMDIVQIIKNVKKACPKARLTLITNGFLPHVIKKQIDDIYKIDPKIGLRVSLDGMAQTHYHTRRIPNAFNLVSQTIDIFKKSGIKDLGIGFTCMDHNIKELPIVHEFAVSKGLEFSVTMATSSPITFGENKHLFRPQNHNLFARTLNRVINKRFQTINPKEWIRGWFESKLIKYHKTEIRDLTCDAGDGFFYLDSLGNIFTCHVKNWYLGNIRKESFETIWNSTRSKQERQKPKTCNDCWMVCTVKSSMKKEALRVISETAKLGISAIMNRPGS